MQAVYAIPHHMLSDPRTRLPSLQLIQPRMDYRAITCAYSYLIA